MRAATIAALFGEGILVTLNATKLIMYWGGYEYYNSISYHESVHKHEEISKYFLCIFRNEIPPIANIKLNLLFIYNNFLQYSTKNTNFVLVKILFMKKRNRKPEMIYSIKYKTWHSTKNPDRHFYLLCHQILCCISFLVFCFLYKYRNK